MGVFLASSMHHTKFEKKTKNNWTCSFHEEVKNIGLLTHHNDRWKPIAIGHLSDSGDLKMWNSSMGN